MDSCADVKRIVLCIFCVICLLSDVTQSNDDADAIIYEAGNSNNPQFAQANAMRFLLYDVNPGEGFNLRRDVYMRVANLVHRLNQREPWTLVLPPWGNLYHWRSKVEQSRVPWATFFDLHSLSLHVPVLEFEDFLKVLGEDKKIDDVYYLQMYEEGWNNGHWEERIDERPCVDESRFKQDSEGKWRWSYWGYEGVYSTNFKCMSVQMQATNLVPFLTKDTRARSVFLVRAEEVIHGQYSEWSNQFWTARRSLVFAKHLRDIGDEFRKEELDSTDEKDGTVLAEDWTKMKRQHGDAKGGPYVAVHLRRRDFLYGGRKDVPNLTEASDQIQKALVKLNLTKVFIATDAPDREYNELKHYITMGGYETAQFKPTGEMLEKYKDGGIAIIDQWICAHARYFIGTSVSTFSFRIHEEREILGFDPEMTFNRFCGDRQKTCEQPSKWEVKYPK